MFALGLWTSRLDSHKVYVQLHQKFHPSHLVSTTAREYYLLLLDSLDEAYFAEILLLKFNSLTKFFDELRVTFAEWRERNLDSSIHSRNRAHQVVFSLGNICLYSVCSCVTFLWPPSVRPIAIQQTNYPSAPADERPIWALEWFSKTLKRSIFENSKNFNMER